MNRVATCVGGEIVEERDHKLPIPAAGPAGWRRARRRWGESRQSAPQGSDGSGRAATRRDAERPIPHRLRRDRQDQWYPSMPM